MTKINDYIIKEVENREELLNVIELVKQHYEQNGYLEDDLKIKDFYYLFSPTTKIYINMNKNKLISTVSMFIDSKEYGLPSDQLYEKEFEELRQQRRKLIEGGMLAGEQGRPLLYLMSVFFKESKNQKADDILLIINPKHKKFYEKMLLFKQIGEEKQCPKVNNAPAILMKFDIKGFNSSIVKNNTIQRIFLQ